MEEQKSGIEYSFAFLKEEYLNLGEEKVKIFWEKIENFCKKNNLEIVYKAKSPIRVTRAQAEVHYYKTEEWEKEKGTKYIKPDMIDLYEKVQAGEIDVSEEEAIEIEEHAQKEGAELGKILHMNLVDSITDSEIMPFLTKGYNAVKLLRNYIEKELRKEIEEEFEKLNTNRNTAKSRAQPLKNGVHCADGKIAAIMEALNLAREFVKESDEFQKYAIDTLDEKEMESVKNTCISERFGLMASVLMSKAY